MVENYFVGIAREVREIMASVGVAKFEDLIGRTDLLEIIEGSTQKQLTQIQNENSNISILFELPLKNVSYC